MSTHPLSKRNDVPTYGNILNAIKHPMLNFAKSMARLKRCPYLKWKKFAFYDPNEYTYLKGRETDLDVESCLHGFLPLQFAKSMARLKRCPYLKWKKFAFYDPNEYAYLKGRETDLDVESCLHGFRMPSLGILRTTE
uniref:DUF295 domain-containing protein n=1 Tax=Ascaris lumbricoides TaxID=6252 RepID=A0A0M3IA80_ASCLU